jgi:uncharacterized protein with HEPN domain
MTSGARLADYLDHMADATGQALSYVQEMDKPGFLADRRTQQAVILNLMILGEAATRVLAEHADFAAAHPQVPWRSIKGMRNRIAHGYFELDLDVVWDTVNAALPGLAEELPAIRARAAITLPPEPPAP